MKQVQRIVVVFGFNGVSAKYAFADLSAWWVTVKVVAELLIEDRSIIHKH